MPLPAARTRWIRPSSFPAPRSPAARSGEESFKLYARDIMQHPIDARLVTISACYGSGTRSYAGEGLVGLSWAFLRAGAHNVIGALWEVSDDSTPQLMDALYQGLADGQNPATALRRAKLSLAAFTGQISLAVLLGSVPDLHPAVSCGDSEHGDRPCKFPSFILLLLARASCPRRNAPAATIL